MIEIPDTVRAMRTHDHAPTADLDEFLAAYRQDDKHLVDGLGAVIT